MASDPSPYAYCSAHAGWEHGMMWPWIAALIGMLGYGLGSIVQSASAKRRGGPTAMIQPLYLLGIGFDALAWIGALIALQKLPLFTVQAILAGSLAVTVLLARFFLGARLVRRDLVAIGVVGLGLVLVAASAGVQRVQYIPAGLVWGMAAGLVVILGMTFWAYRHGAPLLLATLSGLAFSGGALGGRAIGLGDLGWRVVASPILWLMIAYAILAIFAFSRALERGEVGAVMAIMWVVDVIVPGVIGVLILGDTVRTGGTIPAILGVTISVIGGILLAGSAARQTRVALPAAPARFSAIS